MSYLRTPPEIRFRRYVQKRGDCWMWTGGASSNGYGEFWDGEREVGAHIWSYRYFVGPVPDGRLVLHKCDTPKCVRPSHLFVGTVQDNVTDKIRKGRARYNTKYSAAEIKAIRQAAGRVSYSVLARRYGTTHQYISLIVNRRVRPDLP